MNLRIYCINLKDRSDRWARFTGQPAVQELQKRFPFERFEGVNGKKLDIANDNRVSIRTRRNILFQKRRDHEDLDTPGGVGCYLSHYGVWNAFQQTNDNEEACLIFEDDAYVTPTFFTELQTAWNDLSAFPEEKRPDVWILSYPFNSRLIDILGNNTERQGNWEYNVHAPNTAYIVFRKGVQKLIDNALPIDGHLDHYMYRLAQLGILEHVHHRNMNVFQIPVIKKDSDIQKVNCDICDIPDDPRERGYFILSGQNKKSLFVVFVGLATLFYMTRKST
jgi:GR25 family glycosyltransferase involved in LPS biosynthesis